MSTVRIALTALLVLACLRGPLPMGHDDPFWAVVNGLLVLGPAMIFFATEPERLDPTQRQRVPSNRLIALLATPFVRGGGRGALLLLVHLVLALGCFLAWRTLELRYEGAATGLFADDDPIQLMLIGMYAIVYVMLPSGLAARWSLRASVRWSTRALIPLLAFGLASSSAIGGHRFDSSSAGNPYIFVECITPAGRVIDQARTGFWALCAATTVTLLLNLPRMLAGVREVWVASADKERQAVLESRPQGR